jgi:hypothetical protein
MPRATHTLLPRTAKRTPYLVVIRQMTTGTDYKKVLYLKSPQDAFDTLARHVRLVHGEQQLRLVSCTPVDGGSH